jgi:hypothetical protein
VTEVKLVVKISILSVAVLRTKIDFHRVMPEKSDKG